MVIFPLYGPTSTSCQGGDEKSWFREDGLSEPRGGRKDEDEGREYNFIFFSKLPFIETQRDFLSPLRLKHKVIVRFVEIKLLDSGVFCGLTLLDTENAARPADNRSHWLLPGRPSPIRCVHAHSGVGAPHWPVCALAPWPRHGSSAIVKIRRSGTDISHHSCVME